MIYTFVLPRSSQFSPLKVAYGSPIIIDAEAVLLTWFDGKGTRPHERTSSIKVVWLMAEIRKETTSASRNVTLDMIFRNREGEARYFLSLLSPNDTTFLPS